MKIVGGMAVCYSDSVCGQGGKDDVCDGIGNSVLDSCVELEEGFLSRKKGEEGFSVQQKGGDVGNDGDDEGELEDGGEFNIEEVNWEDVKQDNGKKGAITKKEKLGPVIEGKWRPTSVGSLKAGRSSEFEKIKAFIAPDKYNAEGGRKDTLFNHYRVSLNGKSLETEVS